MRSVLGARGAFVIVLMLSALAGCGGAGPAPQPDGALLELGGNAQVHPVRPRPPPGRSVPATPAAHLTFFGGRVIASARVVQVLYGEGTYLPEVRATQAPSLASFYAQALQSAWYIWLSEYSTAKIQLGPGRFAGQVLIVPAAARDGETITDPSLQAELSAQIGAGALPPPDANTLYMVNFPQGKKIVVGGATSCTPGGFCGYHGTFRRDGVEVVYGALPDQGPGSGCDLGCGGAPAQFDNQTAVASHEMVEAITDPEVGVAYQYGPPLAWFDLYNGEIGDICLAQQATFSGTDQLTYTVQKLWSNARGACIAGK